MPVVGHRDAVVVPVADEGVEMLEQPPERRAHREKQQEPAGRVRERRTAEPAPGEPVHREDVAEPERREHMPTPLGREHVGAPGEKPAQRCEKRAAPAPPGKPRTPRPTHHEASARERKRGECDRRDELV